LRMFGLYAGGFSGLEESFESLVPERLNHESSVACCAPRNNRPNA
jgi:hypothetical protein